MKDRTAQTHTRRNRLSDRPISIKEIESIINNLSKQKAPGPDRFTDEFHQISKEEIILVYKFLSEDRSKRNTS